MSNQSLIVSEVAYKKLCALAALTGQSIATILDQAIEDYRRKLFFHGLTADYAVLQADPPAWEEELAERRLLEGTLMDDLDTTERWTEDGRLL